MRDHGSAITMGMLLLQSIIALDYCRALPQRNGKGTTKTPPRLVASSLSSTSMDEDAAEVVDGPAPAVKTKLALSAEDHDGDDVVATKDTSKKTTSSLPKVGTGRNKVAAKKSMSKFKKDTAMRKKKQDQHEKVLNAAMNKTDLLVEMKRLKDDRSRQSEPVSGEPAGEEKESGQLTEDSAESTASTGNDSPSKAGVAPSKVKDEDDDKSKSALLMQHSSPTARIPPPNGIFRFFLSKGIIGRLLVMLFILISEFVSAFLPTIGNAIKAILPKSLTDSSGSYRGQRPSGSSLPSSSQRKRNKSEQLRAADRVALQQLKRASKEGGKYRYVVSHDFMQRHEIGPYATTTAHDDESSVAPQESSGQTSRDGEQHIAVAAAAAVKNDDDEDADWIIEALSSDKQHDDQGAVEGLEEMVDEEMVEMEGPKARTRKRRKVHGDASQRESRVHAAIRLPTKKKKRKGNSFGSILLGQFASSDNRFSRNLLGAYPGDAVPLEQAASATGLTELARRYGWGDWPEEDNHLDDDDDDDDDAAQYGLNGRKKRKRQPRVEKGSNNQVRFEFGFGGSTRGQRPFDDFDEWNPPFPEISSITRSRRRSRSELNPGVVADMESLGVDDGEKDILNVRPAYLAGRPKASRETTVNPTYTSSKRTRPATELLAERRKFLQENASPD
jgi:hypothetical protein